MPQTFRPPHDVNRSAAPSPRRRTASGLRRGGWFALAAVLALTACGEDSDPVAKAEDPAAAAPAPMTTSADSWRQLADGSFLRTADGVIANRREADRCWAAGDGLDCLSLDAIAYPPSAIVVATRSHPKTHTEVPVVPPEFGFSCAIYPSGVIEQRLLRATAPRLQNDDIDGTLWSAADVARLSGGEPAGFVDCKALAARLPGNSPAAIEAPGFVRQDAMPPGA